MRIGLIDADLLDNGTRHPNLALMKISAYHIDACDTVELIDDYQFIDDFDKVYISKVFTRTIIPIDIDRNNIVYGGTGFFLENAPNLPSAIEHHKPDYHLYDRYIQKAILRGVKKNHFSDYLDYSIGFTTRGCFRKCEFCVNKKYDMVLRHSPVSEFFEPTRKYICLWDDNFLGFSGWQEVLNELESFGKPYQFRQGMDIRLLDWKKAEQLSKANYHGDFIFAFDDISDEEIVKSGLEKWRRFSNRSTKLYVLCAYKSQDINDILSVFYRIKVLMKFGCLPYLMRYDDWRFSKFAGIYITLARWCNQPAIFKKMSFRQFVEANGETSSSMRYFRWFLDQYPDFPKEYLDMRFEDYSNIVGSLY